MHTHRTHRRNRTQFMTCTQQTRAQVLMSMSSRILCLIYEFLATTKLASRLRRVTNFPIAMRQVRSILTQQPELGKGLKLTRLTCGGSAPSSAMMRWFHDKYGIEFIQG